MGSEMCIRDRRRRDVMVPVLSPRDAMGHIRREIAGNNKTAIIFGGEKNGLSTDDVAKGDIIISIPVNPDFASLNLAQAVGVIAYEWAHAADIVMAGGEAVPTPANRKDVEGLLGHMEESLDDAGYFQIAEKRLAMTRNLRSALTRARFTTKEIHLLRGAIKALARDRRDNDISR